MLPLLILLGLASLTSAQSDTWTQGTSLSTPRGGLGAVTVDGRIYVLGGGESYASLGGPVRLYDPATDSWTPLPDLGVRRMLLGPAFVNGKIYAIGGSKHLDFVPVDAVEIYDTGLPTTAIESLSWGAVKLLLR